MAELTAILEGEFIPRQSATHDVHDTGTVVGLTTTLEKYSNDGVTRNYSNVVMWDTVADMVDCTMLPVNSKIDISLSSDVAAGNQGAIIIVELRCPNNGSPFLLKQFSVPVDRADSYPVDVTWNGYVGPEVQLYGIEVYSGLQTGTLNVSNRKLLVRA